MPMAELEREGDCILRLLLAFSGIGQAFFLSGWMHGWADALVYQLFRFWVGWKQGSEKICIDK